MSTFQMLAANGFECGMDSKGSNGIGADSHNAFSKTATPFRNGGNGERAIRKAMELLESERAALSSELHDGIMTSLAVIKLKLELLQAKDENSQGPIREIVALMENALKDTRRVWSGLRVSNPDELDLFSSLRRYSDMVEDCNENLKIALNIEIPEKKIPRVHKISIYRIFQEAASNSIRHGHADRIKLRLLSEAGKIVFYMEDDGRGFDVNRLPERGRDLSCSGIKNMRERAEIAGGAFEIRSEIGSGTHILATFPIK